MKKRVVLLGLAIFLVACGNKNTAVTTTTSTTTSTTTTTATPVIEEVAYDISGNINKRLGENKNRKVIIYVKGKNEDVSEAVVVTTEYLPDGQTYTQQQKDAALKVMENNLSKHPIYSKVRDLEGVITELKAFDTGVEVRLGVNFEVVDVKKFKELAGQTPFVGIFGSSASIFDESIPFNAAISILELQKAVKVETR